MMFRLYIAGAFFVSVAAAQTPLQSPSDLLEAANQNYRALHSAEAARLYREYLAHYPDRADVRVYLGACLLALNQQQEAVQEAKRAIQIEPRYAKSYTLLGRIYAAEQSWGLAEQNFRQALQLDPHDRDAWYFLGRACYSTSQFETAVTSFEQALKVGAPQSRVYQHLALSYDALGQYNKAEIAYRKALDSAQGDYGPFFAYGVFLFKHQRTQESISMLGRAFELQPNLADVRFELARVLYHAGKLQQSAQLLQDPSVSNECRVHNLLARILAVQGDAKAAEREQQHIGHCIDADSAAARP